MILAKDRNLSELEFYKSALDLRLKITTIFLQTFCVEKRNPQSGEWEEPKTKDGIVEDHQKWLIADIRNNMMRQLNELINNICDAYSLYPTTLHECDVRRDYQNAALGNCEKILQLFQFVLEIFNQNPYNLFTGKRVNVEKLMPYVELIQNEEKYLKGWRKTGVKIRKSIEAKG